MFTDLKDSLAKMRQNCVDLANIKVRNTWNPSQDQNVVTDFKDEDQVKDFIDVLEFFKMHNLLENAKEDLRQFEVLIARTQDNIKDALIYQHCN